MTRGIHVIGTRLLEVAELEKTEDGDLVLRDVIPQDATIVGFEFVGPFVVVQYTLPAVRS